MKHVLRTAISIVASLLVLISCSKGGGEEAGEAYTISGTISRDSATADASLRLFIDKHTHLLQEELSVLKGHFAYKGKTTSLDELFLVDDHGLSVRLFAAPGADIELSIDSLGAATFSGSDSTNIIYHQLADEFAACREIKKREYLDSVCQLYHTSMVPALVIRDHMSLLADSVHLRKCLGRLTDEAKPSWLTDALEQCFDNPGLRLKKNLRLSPLPKFGTEIDTIPFDFNESRPDALYLYFWADYSQESVDSLQMLDVLADQYGLHDRMQEFMKKHAKAKDNLRPKRVNLFTVCLHASDSAAWRSRIEGLPGTHVLLQDGFSNNVMKSWHISRVPYNLLIDRFSNIQDSYRWGKELRDAFERMPNNFSAQIDGSKDDISRTPRH